MSASVVQRPGLGDVGIGCGYLEAIMVKTIGKRSLQHITEGLTQEALRRNQGRGQMTARPRLPLYVVYDTSKDPNDKAAWGVCAPGDLLGDTEEVAQVVLPRFRLNEQEDTNKLTRDAVLDGISEMLGALNIQHVAP